MTIFINPGALIMGAGLMVLVLGVAVWVAMNMGGWDD